MWSVAPVTTPNSDATEYWHNLEYTSTAARWEVKTLEVSCFSNWANFIALVILYFIIIRCSCNIVYSVCFKLCKASVPLPPLLQRKPCVWTGGLFKQSGWAVKEWVLLSSCQGQDYPADCHVAAFTSPWPALSSTHTHLHTHILLRTSPNLKLIL